MAKGAELLILDFNHQCKTTYQLRGIKDIKPVKHTNLVRYNIFLSTEDGSAATHMAHMEATLNLAANRTVQSTLHKLEIKGNDDQACDKLSREAKCTKCSAYGRCVKGHVPVDPWLSYALETQQVLQIDEPFNLVQMPAAHNAYNNRADSCGVADNCPWPPPYSRDCLDLANQEFSLTDMLNMGIRALEIDVWWCFKKIRMSHLVCGPVDRLFEDGMKEIGEWVHRPENDKKVIRIYLEDGEYHTSGHDDLINGPIRDYLGDRVFTPDDLKILGRWPTLREMRQMKKTVLIATDGDYTHGGLYIQKGYWTEAIRNEFTPYPECGGCHVSSPLRFYCDSTNYGPLWNGPKQTGVILDFTEFMKCGVQYPAADQVSPMLLRTAVWTWAEGQPSRSLSKASCVFLSGVDYRWYTSLTCSTKLPSACVKTENPDEWTLGVATSYGHPSACPDGFVFSAPVNRSRQQKLIEVSGGKTMWINISPYIPLLNMLFQ
ncbi:uncharacterized protein MT2135-like [Diadema setosum]|uniref:uncharacterized protein MT2135-like n=1 Tax=Diadema setosum TaxID=31175 RepID=UPI003B3B1FF9